MDGESLKMVIKTLYGVVPYAGTTMLAIIWIGIAAGSLRSGRGQFAWIALCLAMLGYSIQFLMLSIIATGNTMFGIEANAWLLRTASLLGVVFGSAFTALYLHRKWQARE